MTYLDKLRPYVVETATDISDSSVWFLRSRPEHIEALAKVIPDLPDDLKEFWTQAGSGFIRGKPGSEPSPSMANFFTPPLHLAKELAKPKAAKEMSVHGPKALPFFDLGNDIRLAYVLEGKGLSSIVTYDRFRDCVSPNLEGFVESLLDDAMFYSTAWEHRGHVPGSMGPKHA